MGERVKVLSQRNLEFISRRTGSRPTCYRCGEPLRIGEKIITKPAKKAKYYHEDCWRSMFWDSEK